MLGTVIDKIVEIAKQLALFSLILFGLGLLASAIDFIVPYDILTSVFILIRRLLMVFDFAFDTTVLFKLFGWSLNIAVSYGLFRAYVAITRFFNNK